MKYSIKCVLSVFLISLLQACITPQNRLTLKQEGNTDSFLKSVKIKTNLLPNSLQKPIQKIGIISVTAAFNNRKMYAKETVGNRTNITKVNLHNGPLQRYTTVAHNRIRRDLKELGLDVMSSKTYLKNTLYKDLGTSGSTPNKDFFDGEIYTAHEGQKVSLEQLLSSNEVVEKLAKESKVDAFLVIHSLVEQKLKALGKRNSDPFALVELVVNTKAGFVIPASRIDVSTLNKEKIVIPGTKSSSFESTDLGFVYVTSSDFDFQDEFPLVNPDAPNKQTTETKETPYNRLAKEMAALFSLQFEQLQKETSFFQLK